MRGRTLAGQGSRGGGDDAERARVTRATHPSRSAWRSNEMPHRDVSPLQRSRARTLRSEMTEAEGRIWQRLRAHRFQGASFRRQFPIGRYVVDFVCLDARLIIEIDGGQHSGAAHDVERDEWLRSQGFRILRFWNNDVLRNLRGALERISEALSSPAPPSLILPRKGVGDRPSPLDDPQ